MARKILNGIDLNAQRATNAADASAATDLVTLQQLQALVRGLDWKASVRAATTVAGTLATDFENGDTIDGVALVTGDRILIKDQSSGGENGIYVVAASGAPTRATDADASAEVTSGMAVTVTEGTTNGDKTYVLTTNDPIVLGTTALVFSLLGGGSSPYIGGAGLTLTGDTFAVGQGTGIVVNGDDVAIDTAVVVRKYAVDVGDGSSTTITITHNLGSRDVHVTLYENGDDYEEVDVDVKHATTNTVTLHFPSAPTSAQYRVFVTG